jgi:hypothetical protein
MSSSRAKGLMKIQEEGCPVRHIMNWINSPVYKRTKYLVHMSDQNDPLPNSVDITISVALAEI